MLHSKETITTKFSIDTSGNKALDSATLGKAGHSSSRKVNMDPSRDGKKSPGSANSGGGNFTARKSFTVVGYANEIYNRCVRVEDWKFNSHLVDIWDISPTEIRKKLFQKFNLLTNGAPEDLEKLKGEYIILSGLDEMDGDSIDIKPLSDDEIFAICRGAVGPSRCSLRLVKISAISDYRQNLSRYMIQKNLRHLSPFHSISKAFKPRLHTSSSSVEQSTSSYSVMNNKVNNSIKHFILSSSKRLLKHVTTSPQHERGEGAQKHHKPGRELWRYEGSSPAIANNFSDSDANLTSECARSGVRLDIKPDQFSSVSTESTHSKCSSTPLPVDDDRSFEYKNNESFEMEGGACVSADETRMTLLRDFHQLFGTSDRPPSHIICKNIELFFPGLKFEKVVSDIFLNGSDKFSCSNIADGLPREEARHEEIFPGPRDLKLSVNINTPVLSTVEGDNHKYSAENQENSVLNRASIVNTKVYNSEDITKLAKFTLIQCQKKRLRDLKRTSFGRRASQHLFATISGVNEGTYAAGSSLCRPVNNVNGTESKKRNGSVSISPSDALGFQGVPCSIPCTSMSDKMISSAYSESNGSVRNNGYSENRDSTIDGYRNPQSVDPFSLNCEGHLEVQKSLTCMDSSFCFMNSDSPDIFLDARSALTPETNLAITESADIHNHTGYNGICSYLESSLDNDNSGITKTQNESVDKAPAENISNSRRRNACSTITLSSNVMPYCSLDAVEDIQVGNYYEDSPINDLSRLLPQAGMLSAQNPAATIYLSNIIYSDATPDDATLSGRSNGTPVNFDELHFDENTPHRSAGNVKGGGYNAFKTDVDSTITSNDNGEIHQNLKISSLCSKDTTPKRIVWLKGPLIGKGSFGKVFYAVNMRTYEIMAVKQVDISGKNKGFTKRLIRSLKSEINLMRNISHENVVSYTGFEVRDKTINIFLEYVSGGTVATALSSMGPFEQSLVRSVTCQVLCGLEYLHERNIIHRDIKGTNSK